MAPTFGFAVHQSAAFHDGTLAVDELVEYVQRGEALGYREVVIADHIIVPRNWAQIIGNTFLDAFTLLGYVAAETDRLRLVLGCVVVPYRQPLTVAKAIATLDQLSGGRAALGVVPGYLRSEFAALGVPFEEKLAMTDEFIDIMRTAWTEDPASYGGRYHQFTDVSLNPKCVQRPHVPIWVGGASKGALARAVNVGDVWHPLGFIVISDQFLAEHRDEFAGETMQTDGMTPERLRARLRDAVEMAERTNRDLSSMEVVVMPGPPPNDVDGAFTAMVSGSRAARGGSAVVDWLGQYVEAGATGFVLGMAAPSLRECADTLEQFAEEVIPALS